MGEIVRELGDAYEALPAVSNCRPNLPDPRLSAIAFALVKTVDIVITTQSRIEELAKENKVVADSAAIVARSGIGVAVRAGRPKPDIGSSRSSS